MSKLISQTPTKEFIEFYLDQIEDQPPFFPKYSSSHLRLPISEEEFFFPNPDKDEPLFEFKHPKDLLLLLDEEGFEMEPQNPVFPPFPFLFKSSPMRCNCEAILLHLLKSDLLRGILSSLLQCFFLEIRCFESLFEVYT